MEESQFLKNVMARVQERLNGLQLTTHVTEQSINVRVTRLWRAISTGEDYTASTSSNTDDDMAQTEIDVVALSCLITAQNSTELVGLQ